MTACQWLHDITPDQQVTWGAEAAALASVARAGVPVLPSFVIGREAVLAYFMQPDVRKRILKVTKGLSIQKPQHFPAAAQEIREIILDTPLPPDVRRSFAAYLEELEDQLLLIKGNGMPVTLVALTPERLHMHGTPKSMAEADKLLRQLFAQHFTEQALHQRFVDEEPIVPAPMSILVQYAPASERSGTSQLYDPETMDGTVVYVTATHHEHSHSARSTHTDTFRVDAKTLQLLSTQVADHQWATKKSGRHVAPKHVHTAHTLSDRHMRQVARFTQRAQEQFPDLQRLHWQLFLDGIIVNGIEPVGEGHPQEQAGRSPLLIGHGVSFGSAAGPVRVIGKKSDWKHLRDGDVAVLEQLHEGDVPDLAGVAALITESGHAASVEAMVGHRLAIPLVTGIGNARQLLRNGQVVTVDGTHGAVYAGRITRSELHPVAQEKKQVTGTKITALIDDALVVTPEYLSNTDGVGVLRGEFILRLLGVHPGEILHDGMADEYVDLLTEGVERVVRAAGQREVVYQLHDISEHAFHGWKSWRRGSHEPNQLMGYRGTHRLLNEPEIVELEMRALERVIAGGADGLSVMLPMVRSFDEVRDMKRLLIDKAPAGLAQHLWIRCETPALAIKADDLVTLEPAGVLFDIASLATLITGMDRENHQVGHHRDQADPAVLEAVRYAIATCRSAGVSTAITTEQETLRAEVVDAAIRAGVTSICVRPTDSGWMHDLVASVEQRMLLDHLITEEE